MGLLPRDNQRQRAYNWEDQFCSEDILITREQCQEIFEHLNQVFRFGVCTLEFKGPRSRTSHQIFRTVALAPIHLKLSVLVHEFAHVVVYQHFEKKLKRNVEAHGPEWLSVYMVLLNYVCGHPYELLIQTAETARLRFFKEVVRSNCHGKVPYSVQNRLEG